ncbi:MAG: hypothetical protein ACLUVG_14575 [Phocaeicola vulgatus]
MLPPITLIADAASRQTEYGEVVRQFEYIFGITYVSDLFTVISPDAEHDVPFVPAGSSWLVWLAPYPLFVRLYG